MNFKKFFALLTTFFLITNTYHFVYADTNLNLTSEAGILIDSYTGKVLFAKNENEQKYPASTTKVLTAILAIENCNLDDSVTASSSAIKAIPSGYSNAAIQVGESLTVKQLLEVFLVHSANEAGYILAEHISGSIENFAILMNEKAKELGCTNTNFTNPSGLQDPNHYTTAYDLSLIARYCMQNEVFRSIVSMSSCKIEKTDKYEERYFINTNELINKTNKYYNEHVIGIKTGFTTQARNCLISAYNENGNEFISVVLDAPQNNSSGESAKYTDTLNLFKYGIEHYSIKNIIQKDSIIKQIAIQNATSETKDLNIVISDDVSALVSNSTDITELSPDIKLNENILAPISENQIVGTVTYTIDGVSYTRDLLASHSVDKSNFLVNLLKIVLAVFILLIAFKLMYHKNRNNKNNKNNKNKNYRRNNYSDNNKTLSIHGKYLYGNKY